MSSMRFRAKSTRKGAPADLRLLAVLTVLCRGDVGPEADAARASY